MWIDYCDSEVNCFHPVCERALNRALQLLHKEEQYCVLHHQSTGTLEMDYAVQNIQTKKYLCVIEVKRTPADVQSTRYQFQAMSYVQMNADESERPFYILTNLEQALSFRYDGTRPRAFQQILEPGVVQIGSFQNDVQAVFEEKLAQYFQHQIKAFGENSYRYLTTLEEFSQKMEELKNTPKAWKSTMAILLYEYIRGSFAFLNRTDLRNVRIFRNDISKICEEGAKVDFKGIFSYSAETFADEAAVSAPLLEQLFEFGRKNVNGDFIAGVLHHIVSEGHEHEGEVPTDLELARLVAELAKNSSGELAQSDCVCDPTAGSGNLLSEAASVYGLNASQLVANDWNPQLLELLSLRMGLKYGKTLHPQNAPTISDRNIADLDRVYFQNIKVIVMNPPFVAGINCVERKKRLYDKIEQLTGKKADTKIGQMPLEGVFLELVLELVQCGTTIACVFPKTHLMGRGMESKAIRKLLLEKMGLHTIFTYPGDGVFDEVTKDTCVLIGRVGETAEEVRMIASCEIVPNLDVHRFAEALNMELSENYSPMTAGMDGRKIKTVELMQQADSGWKMLNHELEDAVRFVEQKFEQNTRFQKLSSYDYPMKRGGAGNQGGSDLLFFDSREELYRLYQEKIVPGIGMRNARLSTMNVGAGDSRFLDLNQNPPEQIEKVVESYLQLPERGGKQQRRKKSKGELLAILKQEGRNVFPAHTVLIPRGIRTTGRVYYAEQPVFVSTNFVGCSLPSREQAILLSTWMTTIFYQLICEVLSKDQEGMRKMEVLDIRRTLVPDMASVSEKTKRKLQDAAPRVTFLELRKPEIREVDRIWAEELFGILAENTLSTARKLLEYQANRRNI